MNDEFLKDALLSGNYLTAEDLERADAYAKSHHASFTEYLFSEELLSKEILGQAVAEKLGIPYADLHSNAPTKEAVLAIPKAFAQEHRTVLISQDEAAVSIATDAPQAAGLMESLATIFPGKTVTLSYALTEDIDAALSQYKEKLETRFSQIIKAEKKVAPEIVEQIIEDAIALRASDIHLEPQEQEVIVRFRVDGVLEEAGILPKQYYENILNRIKIEAKLRIDEHQKSQDGAIRFAAGESQADLRVSILPTLTGEKVVMRILGEYLRTLSLAELGLTPTYQARLVEMANRPYGMILTAGPTGSGKTTTLYAILRLLNDTEVNITTIEDPVEYRIPRVNQVQVNEAVGLSFGTGLRTIVRQDPDIVLVGEIRDFDTADIAVNASLTGHLLLSTFHANDASTVIPRLIDMKIEPFLLASTLMIIVSQRLVRRICPNCKVSETVKTKDLIARFPKLAPFVHGDTVVLYRGKGCNQCNGTGYKGQAGIFEFLEVTPRLQELILKRPSADEVARLGREEGSRSFFEDGLDKVEEGLTTYEELLRVALPPTDVSTAA